MAEKEVSPGVIFVRRPVGEERMKLIEDMFDMFEDEGIAVVRRDESIIGFESLGDDFIITSDPG